MNRRNFSQLACVAGIASIGTASLAGKAKQPNLVIIHTDEHNFRTLGCYREQLSEDQAFVWGKGVKVDTPNIDSIAHDGALCTSFYAASPICTPSRASLMSGLYPVHTGSPVNDMPMNDGLVTFAEVLKGQGYSTSYVGKWHLDGDAKPGFAPPRHFGWSDNRYMYNRGHWKMLKLEGGKPGLIGDYNPKTESIKINLEVADETSFTTDFLTDRTLEIIKRDQTGPFCIMLSIPDPHGPNQVRKPYNTMFADMHFNNPRTMDVDGDTMPKWVSITGKNSAEDGLKQEQMQVYFGMVKCIDDNVGRILKYLKSQGLDKNTIVVFTSDHGDLMGEHKKHNKGNPYETSAGIPFVIRYPEKIRPGKLIHTACTTVDFAPTILSIMGAPQIPGSQGLDTSAIFLGAEKEVKDDRIVYLTNAASKWVAAVNCRYKLVLSVDDHPWLFDLEKDPDELINFYDEPEYKPVAEKFQAELVRQMELYGEPALGNGNLVYGSGTAIDAQSKGGKKGSWAASGTELNPQAGGEYMIDAADLSANAMKAKAGSWNRACAVPAGSFEPNSTYELTIDWESKGLADGSDFYANFTGNKQNKQQRQINTWQAVAGETGTLKIDLVTDSYDQWQLVVGVHGLGHLVVKRIRIKKK